MSVSQYEPVARFLDHLKFEKRYSRHTLSSYQNDLEAFFDLLRNDYSLEDPKQISASMVRTWLAGLRAQGVSARAVNRKMSTLKSFFKFLLRREIISINPAETISSLKVSKRLPSFIETEEVVKLLDIKYFSEDYSGRLERLILELLYHTGIRRNELITLRRGDVDPHSCSIKVLGKGNKERLIPVSKRLMVQIQQYLAERKEEWQGEEVMLLTDKGKPLYPKYIYNIVHKHISRVSTVEKKSPHTLRHTFATHLTNRGAQINAVQELLGHSSLAATQIYTHNSIEKLKEVFKKAHPKS